MTKKFRDQATKLHRRRNQDLVPELADPELAQAWRSLQLHWLRTLPGYRELIRARVSEARKQQYLRDKRVEAARDRYLNEHPFGDELGREIDPCG